jgi:predicted ATPase
MAVGHGGQVLCSATTADVVGSEVMLVDLGEHRLQDLDRAMHVFQVGRGTFGPLRSLDVLPGNLPAQATSFVGRHEELAAVAKDLGATRLVTLTGVGGVGKSRLALQVAAELLSGFPDGAWLCELAAAGSPDDLTQVVATALGVVQRAQMSLPESVIDFLRPRKMLVVLDNCEHLLDSAAELAEAILAGAPGVRVLATSREGLGIPGEHVWPLRSLSVTHHGPGEALGEAVVLFADRAQAVARDFVLDETCTPAVVEVCRRLDGIPLAIELAAARVSGMTPAEIAGHLDERFRLLTGGRRGRVERHQTLRATLEWSYSLLTDTERLVFDRLGVFPAAFDAAGAIGVCGRDGIERWDVIDALSSLVTKSMVGAEQAGDTTRYQLLETLRHFARERISAGGDSDRFRRRHAAHYATFAERAGAGLMSAEELVWRPVVAAELDNLRAATAWALSAPSLDDVALGVVVLNALVPQLLAKPSWGIQSWAGAALSRVDQLDPAQRAVILVAAADDAFWSGHLDQAVTLGERAMAESETFTPAMMVALGVVGPTKFATGDQAGAAVVMAEGHRRLESGDAPAWVACGLEQTAAALAALMGDTEGAEAATKRVLVSARRDGIPTVLATALAGFARVVFEHSPEEALAAAEESIGLVEAGAGDLAYDMALHTAAVIRAGRGDTGGAAQAIRTALNHGARIGDRLYFAVSIWIAGFLLAGRPDGFEAAATLGGAVSGPVLGHQATSIIAINRDGYERALASAAAGLGQAAYTKAQQRGAAMTYDQIVTFALDQIGVLADGR